MTQSREQIVARVTDALKGEAGRVAVRGARKVDACGVQDHFWLTAADGVIVATGTDDEAFESACRSIGLDPADETAIIDDGRLVGRSPRAMWTFTRMAHGSIPSMTVRKASTSRVPATPCTARPGRCCR